MNRKQLCVAIFLEAVVCAGQAAPVPLNQSQFFNQIGGLPFIEDNFDSLALGTATPPLTLATGTYSGSSASILFGLWCPSSNCLHVNFDNGVFNNFADGTTSWGATILSAGGPSLPLHASVVGNSGTLEFDLPSAGFAGFYDPSGLISVSFTRPPTGASHAFDNVVTAGHRFLYDGFETAAQPVSNRMNDTGQYWCGNLTTGFLSCPQNGLPDQDGDYGRDALARNGLILKRGGGAAGSDFSKISNRGTVIPTDSVYGAGPYDWGCTRDNVTGLIWEIKASNPGDFRYLNHTYAWYDPNPATNGGNSGSLGTGGTCANSIAQCNIHAYVGAVNALGLCGYTDWRVPTASEFNGVSSLVGSGATNVWNISYFPNTPFDFSASGFAVFPWSATNFAGNNLYAWFMSNLAGNTGGGPATNSLKSGARGVRLVR